MKVLPSAFMVFTFISIYKSVQSTESNEADFQSEEFEPGKISENVAHGNNVKFYEDEDMFCRRGFKKYEDLVKTIDNYVQRYVSLFLITSNLRDYETKDLKEIISIDLDISISGEDLIYLQGYSKSTKDSSYPKNLSKLDAIFSKIARLKERTFAENALRSSKSFFASFNYFSVASNPNLYQFICLIITTVVTWIIYNYLFHKSFFVFLGLSLNTFILWESLLEYWKKLKETNLEIFVQSLNGVPEECDRANLRWYHSLWSYFSEDRCLQYHKNINKNPLEEVSLIKCIIDTYSFYLIRTPLKIYGATVRDLTEEITALWPRPIRHFINVPFAPFFGVLIAIFILVLLRKRLRLSFFGAAVEIGDSHRLTVNERPAVTSYEMAKTVRVIRKLKPWTKSRFPKRLEGNFKKRKKPFLRGSRSVSEVSSQDEQQRTDSHDILCNNGISHDL